MRRFESAGRNLALACLLWGIAGCSANAQLEKEVRQQAETLQGLNAEIARLNNELDRALGSRDDLAAAKGMLSDILSSEILSGDVQLSLQSRGLVVLVLERLLFDPGKAQIRPAAENFLQRMSDVLGGTLRGYSVSIEGHTDNQSLTGSAWRSNWELSAARAMEILNYWVEATGCDPSRLSASGYGEFHPIADNRDPSGRLINRRMEIVIYPMKPYDGVREGQKK